MNFSDVQQLFGLVPVFVGWVLLFCPSPLRLLWLLVQRSDGIQFQGSRYQAGLVIHLLSTVVSPGIPVVMLFIWSKCGAGCANGLPLMFLLPVIWPLFFLGNWLLSKAERLDEIQSKQSQVDAAVLDALEQYRADRTVTKTCPACLSQLKLWSSQQRDGQEILVTCKCGKANGTYKFTPLAAGPLGA